VKRKRFRIAVLAFWLCMMVWLVRFEAFPSFFTHRLSGYDGLLFRDALMVDSWMKIVFKGVDVGYSHTSMNMNETGPDGYYTIDNRARIGVRLMGRRMEVHSLTTISLDVLHDLQKFTFAVSSDTHSMRVTGVRKEGETFEVETKTRDAVRSMNVDIPGDVVLYSPMTEMAMKGMSPGQEVGIGVWNPLSMRRANVAVRGLRHEVLVNSGDECRTTVISMEHQGMEMLAWVDSDGEILRQELPLGLVLEKCTPEEAFEAAKGTADVDEVFKTIVFNLFAWDLSE
jgi:hypothetical protein